MVDVLGKIVYTYTTDQQQLPAFQKGNPNQKVGPNVVKVVRLVDAVTRLVVRDQGDNDFRVIIITDRATVAVLHERPLLPDRRTRNRARPHLPVYVYQGQVQLPVDPLANIRREKRSRSGASTS